MVKYPLCFTCALYDMKTDTCPAFPQGVDDAVLQKKMQEGADIACANNIFYKPMGK